MRAGFLSLVALVLGLSIGVGFIAGAEAPSVSAPAAAGSLSFPSLGTQNITIQGPKATITIKPDGTVDLHGQTLPESGAAFWEQVTKSFPAFLAAIKTNAENAERDALKAQVADLQLAVQALRSQRDAATQALQDAQAQAAIQQAKAQQGAPAPTPPTK